MEYLERKINVFEPCYVKPIHAVQGSNMLEIRITIQDWNIPNGSTVKWQVATSTKGEINNTTFDNNTIIIHPYTTTFSEVGHGYLQVRVEKDDKVLVSFAIDVFIQPDRVTTPTEGSNSNVIRVLVEQYVEEATEGLIDQVETEVQRVIETIPSDYSTLSSEVSEVRNDINEITEVLLNLLYFSNSMDRTLDSGIELSFADVSTIELNGSVGSSNVYLPMMGNSTYTNGTFRPNLEAGTYTYRQEITTGSGDTSGTALYYRTNTSGSAYGFATWSNGTTKTFSEPVEVCYVLSKSKNFVGRKCKLILVSGNTLPAEYEPYKQSAIDTKARKGVADINRTLQSECYTVPSADTLTTFFNSSAYASTHELQGVCSDGTYLYYGMHPNGDDSQNSALGKIDLSTGQLVLEVANHSYGHCNGMCYFPDDNTLIIANMNDRLGTMHIVDADTLDYVSTFTLESALKIPWENYSYGEFAGVGAVGYSDELEKFVFLIRLATGGKFWGFAITDKSYRLEKLLKCENITETVQFRGGLDCDDQYIYMCEQDRVNGVSDAKLVIYDYNGNVVDVLSNTGLGYAFEGVCKISDTEYYISHSNNVIRKLIVTETKDISLPAVLKKYNYN